MSQNKLQFRIEINNIVATSQVDFYIDIVKFAQLNGYVIDENYPIGVHCRDNKIFGLVTAYRTGKLITVGAKTEKQARENLRYVISLLKTQRKQIEIPQTTKSKLH